MISYNDDTIEKFLNENRAAVVMFGASWCMPCKQLRPKVEKLESETPSLGFGYVDVEAAMSTAARLGIMTLPTLVAFHDGQETNRVASSSEPAAKQLVEKLRNDAKS